ncbi:MAG: GYDIA family GHMP kinase [Bacteroidota bacterium]
MAASEKKFSAHGKLLLTGEYLVLDGAKALAIPTRLGQHLKVSPHQDGSKLIWQASDHKNQIWFKTDIYQLANSDNPSFETSESDRLLQILKAASSQKPGLWDTHLSTRCIQTTLEFDRNWGLGTSSTLISLLAQYLEIDPYQLLEDTFGGSGYDLACATANGPITYVLDNGLTDLTSLDGLPKVSDLSWNPDWLARTYFVYLGQKQNSREGIKRYRKRGASPQEITYISNSTERLIAASSLAEAQLIIQDHESIISRIIGLPTVQSHLFNDFEGTIKSLGAWGGDFVWVLPLNSQRNTKTYFADRGYNTFIDYKDMALHTDSKNNS